MYFSRASHVPSQDGSFGTVYMSHPDRNFDRNHLTGPNRCLDNSRGFTEQNYGVNGSRVDGRPPVKKRRSSVSTWEDVSNNQNLIGSVPSTSESMVHGNGITQSDVTSLIYSCNKRERPSLSEDDMIFMSKDEIERCSPSRKDGIDLFGETQLRYSYCAFLQNLGMRLELPQTTIGTAMVLCHRFFVRRSHACYDRFLIATAALFLAAKSEETPRPLNSLVTASCEICHKLNLPLFPLLLPINWFEQYREHITDAEHIILTTLDFDLNVQHPYDPLAHVLHKLGLSQTILVNLAWNLISEGLRSSLWLQFKPHHIAAGAAYLAGKLLNFNLLSYNTTLQEFRTTPTILHDVSQQLMELLGTIDYV